MEIQEVQWSWYLATQRGSTGISTYRLPT